MELIGTIFVIVITLLIVAISLTIGWTRSRFRQVDDMLEKHEILHDEQDAINQQTVRSGHD